MQACQATGRPWCRATPSPSGAPGHGRWCRQCCRSTCRRASRPRRRATLALALALTSACLPALHGDAGVDAAMEAGAEAGVECAMSRMGCVAAHAHSAGKGSWFLRPADACGGHVSHGSGGVATDPGAGAARAADEAQGDAELVQDADKAVLGRTITTAERLGQMLAREVESSALLVRAPPPALPPYTPKQPPTNLLGAGVLAGVARCSRARCSCRRHHCAPAHSPCPRIAVHLCTAAPLVHPPRTIRFSATLTIAAWSRPWRKCSGTRNVPKRRRPTHPTRRASRS